jgi:tRNA uridine 5-carbamoylmethylation protein Kti12
MSNIVTIRAVVYLAVYEEMIARRVAERATQIRPQTLTHLKQPFVHDGPMDRWYIDLDFRIRAIHANEQDVDQVINDLGSFVVDADDPIAENIETVFELRQCPSKKNPDRTHKLRRVKFVENIFRHTLIRIIHEKES